MDDNEPPERAELAAIADSLGLSLTSAELAAFADEARRLLDEAAVAGASAGFGADAVADRAEVETWRTSEVDDPLNAFTLRCALRRGSRGTAEGLRVAIKANVAVRGLELSCGSSVLAGFRADRNADVVERLLEAGAEIVGITNMDDLGSSGDGTTGADGPVRNPFDRQRSAGGSSAGSAASIHYDFVDAALGTDQGGSIRIPASWCGVLGLKPTYGAVSYNGIVGLDRSVDHVGPLARDVRTLARTMEAIAGPSSRDSRTPTGGHLARSTVPLRRVAVLREGFDAARPDVRDALNSSIDELWADELIVDEVSIGEHTAAPGIATAIGLEGTAAVLESGGGYGWIGEYWPALATALHDGLRQRGHLLAPHVKLTIVLGILLRRRYGGAFYAAAQQSRARLTATYDDVFEQYDALLMPTTPFPAQPIDEFATVSERLRAGWGISVNTHAANLTGHPALSLPVAAVDGLPVGLMAVGRRWEDWRLLDFAQRIEDSHGWAPAATLVASGQTDQADRR